MKKLITLLTLVFAISNANAMIVSPDLGLKTAHLNTVSIAEDSPLSEYNVYAASVEIREIVLNEIKLLVYNAPFCSDNMACPAVMLPPIVYTAYITSVESDFCGFITYNAVLDNLADEDELTHIKVVDSSELTCRILAQPTTVELNRLYNTDEGVEKYTHHFLGTEYLTSPF